MSLLPGVDFQDFIDEVIEKNDIVDIIGEYAKMKRIGNRFAALCPLHNDKKSPSLSISPDKQLFHCFGCNAGGNVIHFIMAAEHLDFMDALKYLADRARIPIPEFNNYSGVSSGERADKKQLIYKINSEAARYFYSNLAGENGKEALAYLKDRGIINSTIKMFGLGFAPEGWTGLIDHLKDKGFKEHDIYEAGLAKMRDNGSYYDAFYDGRIMFPIINVQGNIIGFGGRIMTEKSNTGKYLNSPETIVFKKKENLFGLNLAKNNNSGKLLLMEGYMDVISLHQAGITNAVASLGTAFTDEQAKIVKRYAGKAVLCYDSDDAGKLATIRAGKILTSNGIKTKVLTLTDGKDPDEFVKSKGGDMFNVLIETAKPLVEYRIDEIKKQYNAGNDGETVFANSDDMIDFTEEAAKVLAELNNSVELEIYAKRVTEISGVSLDALMTAVSNYRRTYQRETDRQAEQQEKRRERDAMKSVENIDVKIFNAEQFLLSLLCDKSVYQISIDKGITPDSFQVELHKKLAEIIYQMYDDFGYIDLSKILEKFDNEQLGKITKILLNDKNSKDVKRACVQPIETIISAQARMEQDEMLDNMDLTNLDLLLKKKAAESKVNKSGRIGGTK